MENSVFENVRIVARPSKYFILAKEFLLLFMIFHEKSALFIFTFKKIKLFSEDLTLTFPLFLTINEIGSTENNEEDNNNIIKILFFILYDILLFLFHLYKVCPLTNIKHQY